MGLIHPDDLTQKGGARPGDRLLLSKPLGESWTYPGGAHDNRVFFGPRVRFDASLEEWRQVLCFSPETSGGLLLAVPPERAEPARRAAAERGVTLWEIGSVVAGEGLEVLH